MHYDERKLHAVSVGLFSLHHGDEKLASTNVSIDVTAFGHDDVAGPGVTVEVGIPASEDMSLAQLRKEAIERAYWLIQRLATESLEALQAEAERKPLFVPNNT